MPCHIFLTLGANGKTLEFLFFVIRVYLKKIGHILKPLVPKFRPDLFACFGDIPEKQVPANLKQIVDTCEFIFIHIAPKYVGNNDIFLCF